MDGDARDILPSGKQLLISGGKGIVRQRVIQGQSWRVLQRVGDRRRRGPEYIVLHNCGIRGKVLMGHCLRNVLFAAAAAEENEE